MSNAPTVSVVMPVYNGAAYVSQAVQSILAQSWSDFEFIIINDGSTDATSGEALEAGATVLTHLLNRGQGAALQTGIDLDWRSLWLAPRRPWPWRATSWAFALSWLVLLVGKQGK